MVEDGPLKSLIPTIDLDGQRAEGALQREVDFLNRISDAVVATDSAFRITSWNRAAERIYGWNAVETLGRNTDELLKTRFISMSKEEALARLVTDGYVEVSTIHHARSGGELYVQSNVVLLRDAQDQVTGTLSVLRDNTARKHAEEREQREHRETVFANRVLLAFVEYEGDEIFDQALAIVMEEMASQHGVFGYIAAPGHLMCPSMTKMLNACDVEGKCIHYPPDKWKGLWALALTEKRSLYTNTRPPNPPGHPIIHNNLATPILFQGEVIGLLNIANKDGGYTDADRDTLDRFAARVAPVLYAWVQRRLRDDERQQAEAALRASEERYRSLFDNMLDGFAYCRMLYNESGEPEDFIYFAVNDAFGKLTGLTDVIGKRVTEVIPRIKELTPEIFGIYGRVARTGQAERFEINFTPLGRYLSVVVYSPAPDHFVAVFDDITERRQAEAALRESEARRQAVEATAAERQRFLDMLDTLPVIIDIIRPDGRIEWTNRAYREAFGDNTGKLCYESQFGRDTFCAECQAFTPLKTGKAHQWKWTLPGGRTFDIYNYPFPAADGSPAILEMDLDVTERRQAETTLKHWNETLEQRVAEQTTAQKRINDELAATNAELNAFIYSVAHDLRAPLRRMEGFAQMITERYVDKFDAVGRNYFDRIRGASEQMSRLIEDLLRLSHISRQEVGRVDCDLSWIVSSVVNGLHEVDRTRSVKVKVMQGLRAYVDLNLIKIAISNLLENAWKFTSKTENAQIEFGVVELETENSKPEPTYYVKDNGAGFDPAYREKMFRPFQRLHSEKEFEGTGIGLAIVERIMKKHGGEIWAEGSKGKGATVYFRCKAKED